MKNIILLFAIVFTFSGQSNSLNTNFKDTINIKNKKNIHVDDIRYYYYPNLQAYFDLKKRKYYYKVKNVWVSKNSIPSNYRGYSVYNKIYVKLKDVKKENDKPFLLLDKHRKKYPADYKGRYLKKKK